MRTYQLPIRPLSSRDASLWRSAAAQGVEYPGLVGRLFNLPFCLLAHHEATHHHSGSDGQLSDIRCRN